MPSLEVRKRRATKGSVNDIEGGSQSQSLDDYMMKQRNEKSEEELPDNFFLRMLVLYPGLLLVAVLIIVIIIYKIIYGK